MIESIDNFLKWVFANEDREMVMSLSYLTFVAFLFYKEKVMFAVKASLFGIAVAFILTVIYHHWSMSKSVGLIIGTTLVVYIGVKYPPSISVVTKYIYRDRVIYRDRPEATRDYSSRDITVHNPTSSSMTKTTSSTDIKRK